MTTTRLLLTLVPILLALAWLAFLRWLAGRESYADRWWREYGEGLR